MLTLHHLEYSQSFRTLWLLEELGVEYELVKYNRDKKTLLAPDEYKAISPLGTAPVIVDGGLNLSETNAISDYILNKYDPENRLRPDNADYLFWFHASQGSLMPLMFIDSIFKIMKDRSPFLIRPLLGSVFSRAEKLLIGQRMRLLLGKMEADLAGRDWLAGDVLSAADIAMIYPMESAFARGYVDKKYANCILWLNRCYKHQSFVKAKELDDRPSMILPL